MSVLTPETIRAAIEECVTIIRPGEVLAVRISDDFDLDELDELAGCAREASDRFGVKILVIAGEEFARITQGGAGDGT